MEILNDIFRPSTIIIIVLIAITAVLIYIILKLREENKKTALKAQSEIEEARSLAKMRIDAALAACDKEMKEMNAKHVREINSIKNDCAMQIQQEKEQIENRKDVLSKMDEKELLANIMVALDGYGGRISRVEEQLVDDRLAERINSMLQGVTESINEITSSVTDQIDDMKNSIDSAISEMNNSIESSINDSDLRQRMDEISFDLDSVETDVSSIKSTIDDIYSSVSDKYSYDSLASQIDSIQSAVEEAKSASQYAQEAAESARDAIESRY